MSDVDDAFGIPQFLKVTPEIAAQRRASWKLNPPKPMPRFADSKDARVEEPATRALRLSVEKETRARDKAKAKEQSERAKEKRAQKATRKVPKAKRRRPLMRKRTT